MRRPTREERRRDFLRTGADLATTPPGRDAEVRALASVTIADVAELTQMTRGSIYHLWPTQEAYRFDLMRSLRAAPETDGPDPRGAVADPPAEGDVATEAAGAVRRAIDDPAFRATLSFLPYANSDAAKDLLLQNGSAMVEELMSAISADLETSGRRLRPEFAPHHLRSAVSAIVQGLGAIALMHRGLDGEADLDVYSRSAQEAVVSVVTHFSEPAG